jgi:Mrp family chromosome partitioning ATPase
MELPKTTESNKLHELARNIDYCLRVHKVKSVVVTSDFAGEGKSTFVADVIPVLGSVYQKRVLIYDCQTVGDSGVSRSMQLRASDQAHIYRTQYPLVDYVNETELGFSDQLSDREHAQKLSDYFNELSQSYDTIVIDAKTRRASGNSLPQLPIEGAIVVRSTKSQGKETKKVTDELKDKEIKIIGLVFNEGIA